MRRFAFLVSLPLLAVSGASAATVIAPTEDVMTSAFFQGTDLVRGFAGDNRSTFRVSSDSAFGVGPETVYFSFDPAGFAGFTSPVASAVLTVQSIDGGFGANAGPGNPFLVSAHGVTADPLTSITDNTNPGGPIAWDEFFANNILPADAAAITSVDGFGAVEFDVTSVVNDWIAAAAPVFSLALTGTNDPQLANDGGGFLHGFANNTEAPGSTFLTVTQVPEPSTLLLGVTASLVVVWLIVRPVRGAHQIR